MRLPLSAQDQQAEKSFGMRIKTIMIRPIACGRVGDEAPPRVGQQHN
jgi:hypothetical protein